MWVKVRKNKLFLVFMDIKFFVDGSQVQYFFYLMILFVNCMIFCYYFYEFFGLGEYENGEQESGKGF